MCIRDSPKLVPPGGKGMADFVIARDPGYPRAIHLVGIESPGLTSAPAIARHVAPLVAETLDLAKPRVSRRENIGGTT